MKKNQKQPIFKKITFVFFLVLALYAAFILKREHYLNALEDTKIQNLEVLIKDEMLEIKFDISKAPNNAAMYVYARDEEAEKGGLCDPRDCIEPTISDDLIKIQNGPNTTMLDISHFSSKNIYVSIELKPYHTSNWKSSDINCTVRGRSRYIPFPQTLCNNPMYSLQSASKLTKE